MKAIQFTIKEGNPTIVDVPKPSPSHDQVLVKVAFSAIDTALDGVIQKDFTSSFAHSTKGPLYLGWHYSGIVEQVGDNVEDLTPGQAVWGHLQYEPHQTQGAFAEYILVERDACAVKPDVVSLDQAAATATEAMTALQALRDLGGLKQGQSVMIVGAGGSVGVAAVAIAKQLGAHVTAVCSTKDVEKIKALGAEVVLDRAKQQSPLKTKQRFDVIFDTPSAYKPLACLSLLKKGGTYVTTLLSFGLLGGMSLSVFSSKKVKFVACMSKREDLELVGSWMESGALSTPIDSTFNVRDIDMAMERYSSKSRNGRVVMQVEGGF